ncbi:Extracellular matrix-binding ebh, putative [Babesia ovata]|uniref:Extracellular matrix-binding ebh, putative n=1 Tax=Babesia ovata TaxID=189622 RepID=A0A2H6KJ04_9APIC|nr:Extracellular matrix-binding ebh, putative [Babesia ovata]GBE62961.1 Extracellular matrix-binding ebh, putative [Babesia ovata]
MMQPTRCFVISLLRLSPCRHSLNALLHPSFQWIEAADEAVQAAKKKAEDVYGRLDHNNNNNNKAPAGTTIGQNIEKIKQAKDKVSQVDDQLKSIHADLGNWKDAASGVLGTAVGKAQTVHGKLDPDKSKSTLGGKIGEIEDAKNNIISANSQLKTQVDSLSNWISTAEDIRQKAQQKAEEAYSKLDVHAELSKNVKKIVDANSVIKNVNKSLTSVHGNLGTWNAEAKRVLQGAIGNAKDVHDRLDDNSAEVGQKIKSIETNNDAIKQANKTLEENVKSLGAWKSAAEKVIDKAEQKCNRILEKVSPKGPIYKQAEILKEKGIKLFNAAKSAKTAVESQVSEALQAVVQMDASLKKDLKSVKEEIKKGIESVITSLRVNELDKKVKIDLGKLRGRIEGLGKDLDGAGESHHLVGTHLTTLKSKKSELDKITHNGPTSIKTEVDSGLDSKFQTAVQHPLSEKVDNVDQAIEKLGGKFDGLTKQDQNKLEMIFGHIKEKVAAIKGTPGRNPNGNDGTELEGVVQRVKGLARAFVNPAGKGFEARVVGWLQNSILGNGKQSWEREYKPGMQAVNTWLEPYQKAAKGGGHNEQALKDQVINNIKSTLGTQITAAQRMIMSVQNGITVNLTAIVTACNTFVEELDKKIPKGAIDQLANPVAGQIQNWMQGQGLWNRVTDADLKCAVRYTLLALCASVRQVGIELKSLGIDKFGEILDQIKPTVDDLDKQLKEATSPPGIPPTGKNESPAQAVDSKLQAVREKVKGLEENFKKVKQNLEAEVAKLPSAVETFNTKAQAQIKAAAQTAIDKAAGQIKEEKSPIVLGQNKLMEQFNTQFTTIKSSLEHQLKQQVNNHIREDDPPGLAGGQQQKFILAKQYFTGYDNHVKQEAINKLSPGGTLTGKPDEGHLPQAIGNIKNQGLAELKIIDPPGGTGKIDTNTFTVPFDKIQKELEEIKKLVDGNNASFTQGDENQKGVKTLLEDLKRGLGNGKYPWITGVSGLDKIILAVNDLQKGTFNSEPGKIDIAVIAIKTELKNLREKLMKKKDEDVIKTLEDLKNYGLENGAFTFSTNNKWKNVGSFKSIHIDLKKQNEILPKQTDIISNAVDAVKLELARIGIKIQNIAGTNDVLDPLRWFKRSIGKNAPEAWNIQGIHDAIQKLQSGDFTNKPQAIDVAKKDIVKELTALQGVLQGDKPGDDVIKTLEDLMDTGLSKGMWDVNVHGKMKGLQGIQEDLKGQQIILERQPGEILLGVQQITAELDTLRSQMLKKDGNEATKKGVINNLDDMIKQIGNSDNDSESLRKMSKEIDTLNTVTVPKVTEHLVKLCQEIQTAGAYAGWKLDTFNDTNIDVSLKGIENDISLQIPALQAAIAMCDNLYRLLQPQAEAQIISRINKHIDEALKEAEEALTKQARRQYVESAKDALQHFALKAESELGELPGEINRDLFVGFKGLMKYVYGHFDSLESVREEKEIAVISSAFHAFYAPVNEYLGSEIRREHREREGEKSPLLPKSQDHYADRLSAVHTALSALLTHITGAQRYGHEVRGLLDALDKALAGLRPECFARPSTAVIDGVTDGLSAFAAELRNAYISAYSGAALTGDLVSSEAVSERSVTVLTPYGEKLSKVLLSMVPILYSSLTVLRTECKSLAGQQLNKCTDLGSLLGEMGYRVPDYGEQDGELDSHVTGRGITMLLVGDYKRVFNSDKDTKNALGILLDHLNDYYKACHFNLPRSLRTPCNVYEMLVWLTGLPHNCVYDKLCKFTKLCYSEQTENSLYAATFPADALVKAVGRLTADCPSILTRVLGYGSALTTYACDFYSNSMRLYYPQDGEECLHMMLHCVPVKSVLTPRSPRWLGGVPCNPLAFNSSLPHPECTDKSPLQSYLNDCLPGHLPHQVSNVGCEPLCNTCPSAPSGMPCLTPLGFRGFSGSIKTGKQLCKVLTKWFGNKHLPSLLSLEPRPPATLAEHIGFALSLVNDWHDGKIVPKNSLQQALEASATDLSLRLYNQPGDLTAALTAAYGSDSAKHGGCKHPHLTHLAGTDVCTRHQASPFLQALCRDSYDSLAYRHSDLYLSWAVYLPWTLYDLLLCLYTAFKEISCRDWSCDACLHEGPCDPDSHGVLNPKAPVHGCRCPSIVQCTGVMPTLYQYGLTFKDAPALISQNTTCFSFSTQLSQVLHSEYFRDLFHKCDEFLWHIRMPFLFTIVTLWLTATLYIAHSLLYRMDVLHIRSHLLTTSASHQLDVKALLSRTRRMLSLYTDVDYFDDDFHS